MSVKDLITVGIFTVIYFVIFFICAMTGKVLLSDLKKGEL